MNEFRYSLKNYDGQRLVLRGRVGDIFKIRRGAKNVMIQPVLHAGLSKLVADHIIVTRQYDIDKLIELEHRWVRFEGEVYSYFRKNVGQTDYSVRELSILEVIKKPEGW